MMTRCAIAMSVSLTIGVVPISASPGEAAPAPQMQGLLVTDEVEPATKVEGTGSESRYVRDLTRAEWDTATVIQALSGRSPVDVEVRWTGSAERYSGVFFPVTGTIHTLIQGTPTEWSNFYGQVGPLNGRFLDVEVDYFGSDKRYSAIFLEDGDDYSYALRTTNSESGFQGWLDDYLRQGLAIVDFEAYTEPDGDFRMAGVWVDDPNQPRTVLYYHLESQDLSDLLRPLAGRLIDFERYWSPIHGEYRYAVIAAMYPHGEWGHFRWMSAAQLDSSHASIADANTHMTDLETWESNGTVYYGALWGDATKTLLEVDPVPLDADQEILPFSLTTLLTNFEASNQGVIGLWATNLRTGQSLAWRANEPFYLASSAKVAIHIRFWQEIQAGRLSLTQNLDYTNCSSCRDDWYVDNRGFPGFGNGNFGQSFTLERFDRAMMEVSDNGATSALVDDEAIGVSWDGLDLNEWLSGVSGVGQGWWPVTSIHDVDRTILWQGQVVDFPNDTSYFTVPGWACEPRWRTGSDTWGDLAAWLGNPPSLPRFSSFPGHERYYAMGLNSATPRAFGRLLAGLWDGDFLGADTTRDAIESMTEATPLDNLLPGHMDVWAKGGIKGGASNPVSDTGLVEIGPDAVAIGVFTKDNARSPSTIRSSFTAPIAQAVVNNLVANLRPDPTDNDFAPTRVYAGQSFNVITDLINDGGGDCGSAFDVAFYASVNPTISTADHLIGTVRVSPIYGGGSSAAWFAGPFPASIPAGTYTVGFIVDPTGSAEPFGEVGELDEGDNIGSVIGTQLVVVDPLFADDFESGTTGAWSSNP